MDQLSTILSNLLAALLAGLIPTHGSPSATKLPPCDVPLVLAMPSQKWVCPPVEMQELKEDAP